MKKKIITTICIILALTTIVGSVYLFGFYIPEQKERAELMAAVQLYIDNKIDMYEKENATLAPGEMDVAFIGDSLTDGYDVVRHYPDYKVTNRGIGGDTTFRVEERLQVSLYDIQPKVVVMLIGANNMDTMFENYEQIIISMKENMPNTEIILVSLTAMGGEHWGRKNQLACYNNVKIKLLAEKHDCIYVDLYSAQFNVETGEIYEEYTTDGGHQTEEGYKIFTDTITPAIEEALKKRAEKQ